MDIDINIKLDKENKPSEWTLNVGNVIINSDDYVEMELGKSHTRTDEHIYDLFTFLAEYWNKTINNEYGDYFELHCREQNPTEDEIKLLRPIFDQFADFTEMSMAVDIYWGFHEAMKMEGLAYTSFRDFIMNGMLRFYKGDYPIDIKKYPIIHMLW